MLTVNAIHMCVGVGGCAQECVRVRAWFVCVCRLGVPKIYKNLQNDKLFFCLEIVEIDIGGGSIVGGEGRFYT